MDHWHETVENGEHKFHRDFDGVALTITKLEVVNAWACFLPDGKRVIGELRTVRQTLELIMKARSSQKKAA